MSALRSTTSSRRTNVSKPLACRQLQLDRLGRGTAPEVLAEDVGEPDARGDAELHFEAVTRLRKQPIRDERERRPPVVRRRQGLTLYDPRRRPHEYHRPPHRTAVSVRDAHACRDRLPAA